MRKVVHFSMANSSPIRGRPNRKWHNAAKARVMAKTLMTGVKGSGKKRSEGENVVDLISALKDSLKNAEKKNSERKKKAS